METNPNPTPIQNPPNPNHPNKKLPNSNPPICFRATFLIGTPLELRSTQPHDETFPWKGRSAYIIMAVISGSFDDHFIVLGLWKTRCIHV